jgi:hypothetical protein
MVSSQAFNRPTSSFIAHVQRNSSAELVRAVSRPSSQEIIEEIPIAELIEEKVVKASQGIYIDTGLPIPESYDVDTIRALVQDPFHIWVYWEMRERVFENLKAIFPADIAESFRYVLKLTELSLGHSSIIEIERKGNYWLSVFPDRRYRLEVGLNSPLRGFIRVLEADEVRTPRGTVSMNIAEDPGYEVSNRDFAEILKVSGFAAFAGMLGPERVLRRLPPQVSEVINTAASGEELSEAQLDSLPPRLRALLSQLREQGYGLSSLALLHLLPEYLREAIEETDDYFDDALHPQHIAPRYLVGSSEQRLQPDRRKWMPSMAERPTSPGKTARKTSASE